MSENGEEEERHGYSGRVLLVDLGEQTSTVIKLEDAVYQQFLGGYGIGAYLMWKHFPPKTDPLAPEACFAICAGLLTGTHAPFSSRNQIVGKSPLTHTWADSNSGGSTASQLRAAGFDALLVRGKAEHPSVLVIRDDDVAFEPAAELWGQEVPETFDTLRQRYGSKREVGVTAVGPAGERSALIACVMNDRYHAFGRQGFGAIFGSKNLKAIVIAGSGEPAIADAERYQELCAAVTREYKKSIGIFMRFVVWMAKPKRWMGWMYRLMARRRTKIGMPTAAMRQLWTQRGTTAAVSMSVENGDAPVKNWKGVGSRDFPLKTHSHKLDGKEVDKLVTKRLSCGDCPMPCKGIVAVKDRKLDDVRRPDYETLCGFGANMLNEDLGNVVACHDACNRYGMDAVSTSSIVAWAAEAYEEGILSKDDLDGIDLRWGNGEAILAVTEKIGQGEGCGAWLSQGVAQAAEHVGKDSDAFAVHVHGQEPAYHDPRFTSLMGVTYIADPTPGRHTAGSASWNECFDASFPIDGAVPKAEQTVKWKGTVNKGITQAHYSNAYQVMNGLGLCMFTLLTGTPPWLELTNALTGWKLTPKELLTCGERIQNLRAAFNWREGVKPADFRPHPRMEGKGDGLLDAGPLKGITVPLISLRDDYFAAMRWDNETGNLARARAQELGIEALLEGYLSAEV